MRRQPTGPATLAVSPEGFALLPRHRKYPSVEDWFTSRMLKKKFGGADATWRKHMHALQKQLIEERSKERGETSAEARAHVQAHCIGMRKPKHGVPALAIHPEMINRLPELEFAPPMPDGWQTGHMMMIQRRGDGATWTKRIKKEAQEMAEDVTGWNGITTEEAENMVHTSIAGQYQHHTEPSWAASPDLQRYLVEKYPVKKYKPRSKKSQDDSPVR